MAVNLSLEEARAILRRAVEKAAEVDWISTYVVVDEGGNLISMSRMDGAPPGGAATARAKAYLSAMIGGPTGSFSARMHNFPERYAAYQTIFPRATFPGPGGSPIVMDGRVIGGFSSSLSSGKSGLKIEIDGATLSREDVVTAHALQVPYFEQHG